MAYLEVKQVHFSGWNSPNQRSNDQWREALLGSITGAYRKAKARMIADTTMARARILIFSLSEFARVPALTWTGLAALSYRAHPSEEKQHLRTG
jgi:hypothetical protein